MSRLALLIVLVLALLGAWWLLDGSEPQTSSSQAGTEEDEASQRGDPMYADAEAAGEDEARRGSARLEGSEPARDVGARKSTGSEKQGPATVRFKGVTQKADGTVVGGVRVRLIGASHQIEIVSNGEGTFDARVPAGRYAVRAFVDGQDYDLGSRIVDGSRFSGHTLELAERGALLLRPVGGPCKCKVWVTSHDDWAGWDKDRHASVSLLNEPALIGGLPAGTYGLWLASRSSDSSGWQLSQQVRISDGRTTELRVRKPEMSRIQLRVLDARTRNPIASAEVRLVVQLPDYGWGSTLSMRTDEAGAVDIEIPAGELATLSVTATGYADYFESAREPGRASAAIENLVSNGSAEVEILLGKGATVHGRVVDEEGQPVTALGISFEATPGTHSGVPAEVDARGNFRVSRVADGEYVVSLLQESPERSGKAGAIATWVQADPGGVRFVVVDEEDIEDLLVRVTRPVTLRGQVVDADGKAAPGARVWFVPSGQEEIASHEDLPTGAPSFEVFASEDGSFAIPGVHPGVQGVLRASRGDMQAEPVQVEPVDGRLSEAPRRLVLQGAPRLTLTVLDQERRSPVANAPIRISPMDPSTQGGIVEVVSDAKGICVVTGLVPGKWRFSAKETAGRFPPQEGRIFDVTREPMEITIEVDTGLVFEGAVVDAGLDPIKDATVHVHRVKDGRRTHAWHARTDASGRFDLQGIYAGDEYVLEIKHSQFVTYVREDIQVSQRGLRIGLEARAK